MKGIDSTGAALVHVPGWVGGWVDGSKSRFKDCLQQSKTYFSVLQNGLDKLDHSKSRQSTPI